MITIILSLVALLALLYIIRKPSPVPNRQGTQFNSNNGKPSQTNFDNKQTLTVASFNVQTGKNLHGQRNIRRAAAVLQHTDLAGIQEVYAPSWLNKLGFGISQTEMLAQQTNFNWLFCPTRYRWCRENRGNAILSKLPISSWRTILLADQSGISYRNMTVVTFQWDNQNCYFINTHLHTGQGRIEQLQQVIEEFNKYSRVVLVGDFNSKPDTALLATLLDSNDVSDAILHCNIDPNESDRIDWIITKGWNIISGKMIEKGVSDHPYYEINLQLINK